MSESSRRKNAIQTPQEAFPPQRQAPIAPDDFWDPPPEDLAGAYGLTLLAGILVAGILVGRAWLLGQPLKPTFGWATGVFVMIAPIILMGPLAALLLPMRRKKWSAKLLSHLRQALSEQDHNRIRLALMVRQIPNHVRLQTLLGMGIQRFSNDHWNTLLAVELEARDLNMFQTFIQDFGKTVAHAYAAIDQAEFGLSWAMGESVLFTAEKQEDVTLAGFPLDGLQGLDKQLEFLVSGLGTQDWPGHDLMAHVAQRVRDALFVTKPGPGLPARARLAQQPAPIRWSPPVASQNSATAALTSKEAQEALQAIRSVALARNRRWTKVTSIPTFELAANPLVIISLQRTVYSRGGHAPGPILVDIGLGVWSYLGLGENIFDYGFEEFFEDFDYNRENDLTDGLTQKYRKALPAAFSNLASRIPPDQWTWYLLVEIKDDNLNQWRLWVQPVEDFDADFLPEDADHFTKAVLKHLMKLLQETAALQSRTT